MSDSDNYPPPEYWGPSAERAMSDYLKTIPPDEVPAPNEPDEDEEEQE